jgi:hypothetical protein
MGLSLIRIFVVEKTHSVDLEKEDCIVVIVKTSVYIWDRCGVLCPNYEVGIRPESKTTAGSIELQRFPAREAVQKQLACHEFEGERTSIEWCNVLPWTRTLF